MNFNRKEIPFYKRALSFVRPVWLQTERGYFTPQLDILLYKDRFQLGTTDALYSDGEYYTPAVAVMKHLRDFLPSVKNALVLGVGLGSMVQVMEKEGYEPSFTLVEIDKAVLRLAVEFLAANTAAKLNPVCMDANEFMSANEVKFDLAFIDIFSSREVPDFVTSQEFLVRCRESLSHGGRVAFNYIINDEQKWEEVRRNFSFVFPDHHIISSSINRIFISKTSPTP